MVEYVDTFQTVSLAERMVATWGSKEEEINKVWGFL